MAATRSKTRRPSRTTSGPMPSPPITAIAWVLATLISSSCAPRGRLGGPGTALKRAVASSGDSRLVQCFQHRLDLGVREHAVHALGSLEDRLHALARGGDRAALEPVDHVALAAHGADLDALPPAHEARRHARVDPVGEPGVTLLLGLDHGGR